MKKKIALQGTTTSVDVHSQTTDEISFTLNNVRYEFEVVHRLDPRKLILRSIATRTQHLASVGLPAKSGAVVVRLPQSDVTILPINRNTQGSQAGTDTGPNVVAPLSGIIRAVKVANGDTVAEGTTLAIIEAMKMQMPINAHRSGTVIAIHAGENEEVREGALLIEISD